MTTETAARVRRTLTVEEGYSASVSEQAALAFWLGTKNRPGFVHLHAGRGWHIRDGRRQNVVGLPDVLMLLPKPDMSTLLVALELKVGDDRIRPEQWDALHRFHGIADCVCGVVRYGRLRIDEFSQDEAVAAIERALAS